jgi:hypothetical protein
VIGAGVKFGSYHLQHAYQRLRRVDAVSAKRPKALGPFNFVFTPKSMIRMLHGLKDADLNLLFRSLTNNPEVTHRN